MQNQFLSVQNMKKNMFQNMQHCELNGQHPQGEKGGFSETESSYLLFGKKLRKITNF